MTATIHPIHPTAHLAIEVPEVDAAIAPFHATTLAHELADELGIVAAGYAQHGPVFLDYLARLLQQRAHRMRRDDR